MVLVNVNMEEIRKTEDFFKILEDHNFICNSNTTIKILDTESSNIDLRMSRLKHLINNIYLNNHYKDKEYYNLALNIVEHFNSKKDVKKLLKKLFKLNGYPLRIY